jgi:hypothetical protein
VAGGTNWLERRLARWDARNQRALDRQAVEEGRQGRRETTVTAPDGTVYRVVAVKVGTPLRGPDLDGGGGGDLGELVLVALVLLVLLVAALIRMVGRLLPRRPHGKWKVGVLRPRRWWWAKLVYRERLGVGGDEVARVAELARQIETGAFTSAKR